METILKLNELTRKYDNHVVVDNVDLEIKKGEIFGLLGPNGAGKSTTMNMICGIVRPTLGNVEFMGKEFNGKNKELCKKLGYIPQDLAIHESLKAWENVLSLRRKVLGETHPATISSMSNIASSYYYLERYKESITLNQEVLEKYREVLGEDHPDTLICMHNLAAGWFKIDRFEKATALSQEIVDKKKRLLGMHNNDTVSSMTVLYNFLYDSGQIEKAKTIMEELDALGE